MLSQDIDWPTGVRLDLTAQLADVDARIVLVVHIFMSPDLFQKIALVNDPTRILQKNNKKLKLGRGQVNSFALNPDMPALRINT